MGPLTAVLVLAGAPCVAHGQAGVYEVGWGPDTFPDAVVRASIRIVDGQLQTSTQISNWFPTERAWAEHIEDLTVRTPGGDLLGVREGEATSWVVENRYSGPAEISYRVNYGFARRDWPGGNEQVAWTDGESLFSTGHALFVYSTEDGPFEVGFDTGRAFPVMTAWERIGRDRYRVPDGRALIHNALATGHFAGERSSASGLELRIALFGPISEASELVGGTANRLLAHFVRIMNHDEAGQFMVAMLPGENDGEAYVDSFASSQPGVPSSLDQIVWANSLAHEFFHYWNGMGITSTRAHYAERQWFTEGFTEYAAIDAMRALDLIDERTYDEILSQYLSAHLLFATNRAYDGVTIREAGQLKGTYRPGVYDSGVAAAFCLDGLIREATDGAQTAFDLLRTLYERHGRTRQPVVFDDFVTAATDVAGADLSRFFADFIEARSPMPIMDCASRMGYRATVDGYHAILRPVAARPPA